jgi:hypothetical protein
MATSELERLERRMERRWHDLAMAERRGQPVRVLERMYDAYLRAVEEYVQYQRRSVVRQTRERLAS